MKLDKRACRHAANVPLHISLNAGVLYTERVKYLVTAAVKLLGGHRVLAVYFYECERLKANDRMPKWVVFQGKDTFATLERDAEGNVKWRDAMVQHLTDYYMGDFLQSCVFYKKAGCHTIARYIGAKSDPTKVLWELNWYQQDIRDQQTKIRRYKRDTVVLNKMSSVPQTPANLKRWADKHIMPHYLFYDYNNGRVKTQVYCTYCEKFSVIKRPKNNDVLRCPKCDQKVIAKAQGRRAAYYEDRETCQVVQQISPHELVVRIYKLYWSYVKGKDTTRKSAYEVMRIFVCGDDGKKATIEPYYYSRDYDSVTHWRHGHHPGALFGMKLKKDRGRFTVRFDMENPDHVCAVEYLERQRDRGKAQYLADAILCYEKAETKSFPQTDRAWIEQIVQEYLEKQSMGHTPNLQKEEPSISSPPIDLIASALADFRG